MPRVLPVSLGWAFSSTWISEPFEERPTTITLECVDNLNNNRTVQGHTEKCALLVIEALRERGYVGQWRNVSATRSFLPHRRPRVWALFLKVRRGMGPKAILEHERELGQAFDCISKRQTTSHEALKRILDCSPLPYAHRPKVPASRGQAWKSTQGPNVQSKHGLLDDYVQQGQYAFLKATVDIIAPTTSRSVVGVV